MRRVCCAICAVTIFGMPMGVRAADLKVAAAPVAPDPVWSWTGFYGGVHLGNGWANETWQSGAGPLAQKQFDPFIGSGSGNGAVGGGQIGWNYQTGPWVLGAEAALSAANINTIAGCGKGQFSCTANIDRLGTFTGRLGLAFDRFQIYGKGGAAVARTHSGMAPFESTIKANRETTKRTTRTTTGTRERVATECRCTATAGSPVVPRSGAGPRVLVSSSHSARRCQHLRNTRSWISPTIVSR
jgi:opacity protein-like surface antigen